MNEEPINTPPTADEVRLARAVLDPLTDMQRRAVYAVVAFATIRELERQRQGA